MRQIFTSHHLVQKEDYKDYYGMTLFWLKNENNYTDLHAWKNTGMT